MTENLHEYDNTDDFVLESINECRALLGCSRTTLYKLIRSGQLRTIYVCGHQKIPKGERLRFIQDQLENKQATA